MPSWSTWKELFRISTPVGLVAKLDRAYRMPSGLLVLVEFKTRWSNQPCLSDVIQLSAQRMAVMGQTGQSVASYGYVMVKAPTPRALPIAHRVKLMTDEQVVALVRRREDVLAGRVLPRWSCLGRRALRARSERNATIPAFEESRHCLSTKLIANSQWPDLGVVHRDRVPSLRCG
jgi:CRISPR-associated exonuclease Cas4